MLQTLKIENVALIDCLELHFDKKLNVISGETGAGKSIMLDSLSFVFGGRADKSLIRTGSKFMRVEVIFNELSKKHINLIKDKFNIDCDAELFLSRELDVNGKNICKINGELVPVATVKKVCQMLVDIHGQSEHLAILDNDYQLKIIDLFSKQAENVLIELNEKIEQLKFIEKQIKDLGGSESEKQNLIDLYSYQINEIENAKIEENEFDNLQAEKKEMQQFEKINESLKSCYESISNSSFAESTIDKINQSIKSIQSISTLNNHYEELLNRLNSVLIEIQDINDTVHDDLINNIFDEERFNLCKNKILTYISNSTDSPRDLIELYFGFDFTKTVASIEELEANYVSVTKEDVISVSKMMKRRMVSILKEDTNNG